MAVSASPASYFADLYTPAAPCSGNFPCVLRSGSTSSSTGGSSPPPPPVRPLPTRPPSSRASNPRPFSPRTRRHSPTTSAPAPPYRPTLDFAPLRPPPSPASSASAPSPSPSAPEDACEAHSRSHVCAATELKLKRRAQNRLAQRAFRARQTARVAELEREVGRVGAEYEVLWGRFERLRGEWERLGGGGWEDEEGRG